MILRIYASDLLVFFQLLFDDCITFQEGAVVIERLPDEEPVADVPSHRNGRMIKVFLSYIIWSRLLPQKFASLH